MNERELNELFESYETILNQETDLKNRKLELGMKLRPNEDYLNSVKNRFMFFTKQKLKSIIKNLKEEFEKVEKQMEDNKKQRENQEKKIMQAIINIDKYDTSEENKSIFMKKCMYSALCDLGSPDIVDKLVKYLNGDELYSLNSFMKIHSSNNDDNSYYSFLNAVVKYNKLKDNNYLLYKKLSKEEANVLFNERTIKSIANGYDNLYSLKDIISDYYKEVLQSYDYIIKTINEKISLDPKKYLERYIEEYISNHFDKKMWMDEYFDIIFMIIDEVRKNENLDYTDLKRISHGGYSTVYEIGNKIIKLGERMNYKFPDNPYIVKPLLRKNLGGNIIEITEKVETKISVSENQLYEMYAKLRDIGLVWTDIKADNLGRLLKDNVYNWNSELSDSSKSRDLDEKVGNQTLKKGDLILLDADWIFEEGSKIKVPQFSQQEKLYYKFRDRYDNDHLNLDKNNIDNIVETDERNDSVEQTNSRHM